MGAVHTAEYERYLRSPEWRKFRDRMLKAVNYTCQRCRKPKLPSKLHVHHLHYDTLGHERPCDVEVVCADVCHKAADRERKQEVEDAIWEARLDGWATKVYGDGWEDWPGYDEAEEAFNDWLDRQED